MQLFNRPVSARGVAMFGFEAVLISSTILMVGRLHADTTASAGSLWAIVLMAVLCELCFYYNDLYDLTIVDSPREVVVRVLQAAGAAAIVLAVANATAPSLTPDARTSLLALTVIVAAVLAWRGAFSAFAHDRRLTERLLILGTGSTAQRLAGRIAMQHDFAYQLIGFVDDGTPTPCVRARDIVGSVADLDRVLAEQRVDRIVVGISDQRGRLPIAALLRAKLSGIRVEDATTAYERLTGKILIDDLKPSWLVFSDGFRASRWTRAFKRLIDLTVAVALAIVAAPAMLLTAIAVRLESRGPALYSQERVGEHGRVFTLYKFRSMRADAECGGTPI